MNLQHQIQSVYDENCLDNSTFYKYYLNKYLVSLNYLNFSSLTSLYMHTYFSPMLYFLDYEKNAYLFSSGDIHENDYKLPVWFSEPFARGIIFSNTLLYSCLSSVSD